MAEHDTLTLAGVSVSITGAEVLHGVDLTVGRSEIVAILGANGAGKTTLLRSISGVLHPHAGTIAYLGNDITRTRPERVAKLGIAHVPEGRRLFPRMTVRENLEIGLYRKWPMSPADIDPAFDMFPELQALSGRQAFSLSGGEQQMVALARAMLSRPDLILLDEPSLGLAPFVLRRIVDAVKSFRNEGSAVLLVEQDTAVAIELCDRGYVVANGRVVYEGFRSDLEHNAEVRAAYLGVATDPALG